MSQLGDICSPPSGWKTYRPIFAFFSSNVHIKKICRKVNFMSVCTIVCIFCRFLFSTSLPWEQAFQCGETCRLSSQKDTERGQSEQRSFVQDECGHEKFANGMAWETSQSCFKANGGKQKVLFGRTLSHLKAQCATFQRVCWHYSEIENAFVFLDLYKLDKHK